MRLACVLQKADSAMKTNPKQHLLKRGIFLGAHPGKIGWILLWAIGVPIPLLLIFFLLRGCT